MNSDSETCLACKESPTLLYSTAFDDQYFTEEKKYQYYQCKNCEALSIYPIPSNEKLKIIYPQNYYAYKQPEKSFLYRVKAILDKAFFYSVLKGLNGSVSILDIGGGAGWHLNIFKSFYGWNCKTTIIDLDKGAQTLALQNGHHYFCGAFEKYSTAEKYDLILMLNLIEHVSNPKEILIKAKELLKKNGKIIVQTPNYESLDGKLFKHYNWGGYHCPRHFVLFNQNSFIKLCRNINLKIINIKNLQGAPFWSWSILSFLLRNRIIQKPESNVLQDHFLFPYLAAFFAAFDILRSKICKTSQFRVILSN